MVKRKEKTDKQYHGQKKRKDRQTIPWSKEKKRQTNKNIVKRNRIYSGERYSRTVIATFSLVESYLNTIYFDSIYLTFREIDS
jgi:hypothetical protein